MHVNGNQLEIKQFRLEIGSFKASQLNLLKNEG